MLIFIWVDKTIRLTLWPHNFWTLWKVKSEQRGEGRDGHSQEEARQICLSMAWTAKDNWYMVTVSLQFCGETNISAHPSISVTHTMTATPFSPTAIYRPSNWNDTRRHSASNILHTSAGTILPGAEQATNSRTLPQMALLTQRLGYIYTATPSTQHVVVLLLNSIWLIMCVSRQNVWWHVG